MAVDGAELAWFIEQINGSQAGLDASVAGLTDAEAREPSGLPGWTRAHVLTHVARNAETLAAMLQGAARGELVPQYGGSRERREADIAAGAGRPAGDLVRDVAHTSAEFLRTALSMTPDAWTFTMRWLVADRPATFALESRWREVEIHRVDLALGYLPGDWPAAFVERNLSRELRRLPRRAPDVPVPRGLRDADLLGWLFGRPPQAGLPPLPAWG